MASDPGSRWAALGALALSSAWSLQWSGTPSGRQICRWAALDPVRLEIAVFGWNDLCAFPNLCSSGCLSWSSTSINSYSPCSYTMKMNLSDSYSTEAAIFSHACCSSMLVDCGGKMDVEDFGYCKEFQILEVNRRKVDLKFGFRCLDVEPHNF